MIDPGTQDQLKATISASILADRGVLDQLRAEIKPLKDQTRRIQPRATTSISLVATDGGNNQLQFDPFLVQIVRVVDSSNNEYCLDAVSPTTPIETLDQAQYNAAGEPITPLGEMMDALGVKSLAALSHMIRPQSGRLPPPSWVQVYRELVEWAILFALLKKDFGTDVLIVCDGLLRSKVFAGDLFQQLLRKIQEQISRHLTVNHRKIYLVGMAKHSKVLTRYRLAMALESVLQTNYPAYVEVPRDIEQKAYIWSEYARGDDTATDQGEINKFVGGKMFLVKFGNQKRDPVWPVDIFVPQATEAQVILGCMLADAIDGFPIPHYPRCLQKAHENAALVDFDYQILQDYIYDGVRNILGSQSTALDIFHLQDSDPAQKRYE